MNNLVAGAAFGAALTASGVYQPSVILSQLKFENFHMIQTFLTAAASSAAIVTAAQKLGYIRINPRNFSSLGLFAPYDGNIIGGMLLGTGMLLAGACPGTVLAQIGVGVRSGFYAFEGATIAGIVWSAIGKRVIQCEKTSSPKPAAYDALGVRHSTLLLAFEAVCATAVVAAYSLTSLGPEAKIPPVLGGLFIAAAQLLSIVLRRSLMGTSTSYEEVGDWFWGVLKGTFPQRYAATVYCAGMVAGAFVVSRVYPALGQVTSVAVSPLAAGVGGFLMILGSRIAGGCTSGHGISGMSLLSTSSFLTIGTAFAWGGLLGLVLG
ncbi:hypothetical protein QBC47DRAFT_64361 [Echria macrotheca]|uniref:Sulphur transport domain-containing protein n=1 Tax=Echria macrotheca TaxID=438768 RepID=A0AAJ0B5H7_9PEZI|nr:hypothetical protein QBC47DRAFT_64361 [Echria macrotheca]